MLSTLKCPMCRGETTACSDTVWGIRGVRCATQMFAELEARSVSRATDTRKIAFGEVMGDVRSVERLLFYSNAVMTRDKEDKHIPCDVIAALADAMASALVWSQWENAVVIQFVIEGYLWPSAAGHV